MHRLYNDSICGISALLCAGLLVGQTAAVSAQTLPGSGPSETANTTTDASSNLTPETAETTLPLEEVGLSPEESSQPLELTDFQSPTAQGSTPLDSIDFNNPDDPTPNDPTDVGFPSLNDEDLFSDYLLGPGDQIQVLVIGYDEFQGPRVVLPDGTITMPLIGSVPAAGRTLGAVSDDN
jgi:hypothetical protein